MHIAVVGSGYVGLVAGACFADLGHQVIVVDNDQAKLAALKSGAVPIHEKFLPELLLRHRDRNLTFSDDLAAAVRASDAIFVAVGTPPTEQGEADLSYVESVARGISGAISSYKVVVEKVPSRFTPATGCARLFCATPPRRIPSISPPTPSFCARAPRLPTFSIPTASWWG